MTKEFLNNLIIDCVCFSLLFGIFGVFLMMVLYLSDPPGTIDNSKIAVNKNGHITLKTGNAYHQDFLFINFLTFVISFKVTIKFVIHLASSIWCISKLNRIINSVIMSF